MFRYQQRYEIKFVEIGTDDDHVHFLVQSILTYSVTKIVTMIKSLTVREMFKRCPWVKPKLWGGEFWSDGFSPVQSVTMRMRSQLGIAP